MAIFEVHIENVIDLDWLKKEIKLLNQKLNTMATALEDLKEKLAVSDAKIDIIVPAIQGVKADMAFIKGKLEAAGEGSINPAGVAELLTIVTAQNEKLATASADLAALDAETTPEA